MDTSPRVPFLDEAVCISHRSNTIGKSMKRIIFLHLAIGKIRSPDGDTEYFDSVAGVLQGDTLAPYLFIICLDYVLRTSIDKIRENGFELTKKRSRSYPAKKKLPAPTTPMT